MNNQNNQPETINQYIDMDIVKFIEAVTNTKSFTEINGMIKLMEMEQSRLIHSRLQISHQFAKVKTNSADFEGLFLQYVGTFVLEQKLVDRKSILEHLAKIKGAQNVLSPKANKSSSAWSSEPSERTSTSKLEPQMPEVEKTSSHKLASGIKNNH